MVIGVCVTHAANASETKIHMDVASRVMHVSDASIYIEGGYGKLSLSTGAYGGSVSGIGSAGDQVKVDGAVNATLSSVSFLGFSGHGAVAVDSINLAGRPNYAFGTSTNLLGLTTVAEMEDEQGTTGYIDKWDAATSYDLNGMSVGIATDSNKDWAMSLAASCWASVQQPPSLRTLPQVAVKSLVSASTPASPPARTVLASLSVSTRTWP